MWSDACKQEFDFIKSELSILRILHPIDVNKEFVFLTDASEFGLAWAACQLSEQGELQLIGFGGNRLTAAQAKSWSSTKLELAAVCSANSKFSSFLTGKTTHIIPDNLAVCHLKTLTLQSARVRKNGFVSEPIQLNCPPYQVLVELYGRCVKSKFCRYDMT